MVNINNLASIRLATDVYNNNKTKFDDIRDIGIRSEAALKIIIGDISFLTLGNNKKIKKINKHNITDEMKKEIKDLFSDIKEVRNYSSHNDVNWVKANIENIEEKLREDRDKADDNLNKIYEYMFVIYFSKSKYANNLTNLELFSLLPPFFRHNVLCRYFSVINKIVSGSTDIIVYLRGADNLDEKKLEEYKMAIHDIKISLENIYDGISNYNDLSQKNNFYAIDSVIDYIYITCKDEVKYSYSSVFNKNSSFDFFKKINNSNIKFNNIIALRQWLDKLNKEDIKIIEKIKEINVLKLWAYSDKFLLAKFKDKGIEEALRYIDNNTHSICIGDPKKFKDFFKSKICAVDCKMTEDDIPQYKTFEEAKKHFEIKKNDYDLEKEDVKYLVMLIAETYNRVIDDSNPIKDLNKYLFVK